VRPLQRAVCILIVLKVGNAMAKAMFLLSGSVSSDAACKAVHLAQHRHQLGLVLLCQQRSLRSAYLQVVAVERMLQTLGGRCAGRIHEDMCQRVTKS
jgi:hypothetical protein